MEVLLELDFFYNSEFSAFSKVQQNKKAYAYAETRLIIWRMSKTKTRSYMWVC